MSAPSTRALKLHHDDDVAVALTDLRDGDEVLGVRVIDDVAAGHKLALRDLAAGLPVRKYGQVIGLATVPIRSGEAVHVHNLAFTSSQVDHAVGTNVVRPTAASVSRTFEGYVRSDGKAGTRNYIGVLSSVNCSTTVGKLIAQAATPLLGNYPGVDGIVPLGHGTGCGLATDGDGLRVLRRTLRGYAAHPNFAGILVVGLGCEVNQIASLDLESASPNAKSLVIQDAGGTTAAVRAGVAAVEEMLAAASICVREPVALSRLILGLNCGGSDAYSGITANPALGVAADMLVAHGGTAVLAETPEIYGAEHFLTARAARPEIAEKLLARIAWWDEYTARHGGTVDGNPSPGNKAGGLTTILEKSLGAVAKGGSSPLEGVYEYAEQVIDHGLVFMDTPGYDPVSVTGIVAGGAQVVCFTTGRGSVFGCKPAPSIKLCSNPETYARMSEDMDINCGAILDGGISVEEMGARIFETVIATASGATTASEQLGFGIEEFAPWQLGAVL
ncbi:MAG TPA: altronate dehydratase family protein [Acidothermaceae bacterium]